MSTQRYRVVQWATGNSGQRALREVIRHPAMELVGVFVYDPVKEGVDAGALCGERPTGIAATTDREAVLALNADCVVYMPRAAGAGPTRAGLSLDQLVADVVALTGAGTNMVTLCTDFFARGHNLGVEGHARVLEACARSGASIYPTGTTPGFITEVLPFALLSMQRRVECVEIEEFGDLSRRDSAHMIFEQMKFGKPLDEFDLDRWASHLLGDYAPAFALIAEAAGITVEEWNTNAEVAAARRDTPIVAGVIEAGTTAAQRLTMVGRSQGAEVVRFIQYAYCTMEVEPAWELRPTGWRVQVQGDGPFDVSIAFPVPLEELGSFVPAYNANRAVNAIPYVCAAPPGILSTEDLPVILPRGPRTAAS